MDKNSLVWVLESCLLYFDGFSKKQLLEFGTPEELADMGIKLCKFLMQKEIKVCYN